MAKRDRTPMLLTALGAFVLLRQGIKGAYQSKVHEEVMRYRNKMFDVGPNCEITLKEGAGGGGDASEDLQQLWDEFAYPIVKDAWDQGKVKLVDLTAAVMAELFPEKQCVWPPQENSPESQVAAFSLMMTLVSNQITCQPGDPMPDGFECMSYAVDEGMVTALGGGGFMLGMMAKQMGGTKALKEQSGEYRLFIRAPKGV